MGWYKDLPVQWNLPLPPIHSRYQSIDIAQRILVMRGRRVLLDADLAAFYGVPTKAFNQQVRRNLARFPPDFMFALNEAEYASLRSQFVTLKLGRGQHRKYLPLAFTEHGAIMAAAILNSPRATEISVYVVRAFIELRNLVAGNKELASKMKRLERKVDSHDQAISGLIESVRDLLAPPEPKKRSIGFVIPEERKK
jgi:ORF6N domain